LADADGYRHYDDDVFILLAPAPDASAYDGDPAENRNVIAVRMKTHSAAGRRMNAFKGGFLTLERADR
jgi:hypothetical protein